MSEPASHIPETEPVWRVELFGGLRVVGRERVLTRFPAGKARPLLARLAYFLPQEHPREELIELFWPEVEPEAGRLRLRVAVNSLRRQLEPPGIPSGGVLIARGDALLLNPAAVSTDTAAFEESLQAARASATDPQRLEPLARAVALHKAPLLPGSYEDWILHERERLGEACLNAVRQLVLLEQEAGHLERALDYARRAVAADPLREECHQDLIRLLALHGRRQEAQAQYRKLRRILREHLGVAPLPETLRLLETLPARSSSGPPAPREMERRPELPEPVSTSSASVTAAPVRLPLTLTRFFGRQSEIEEIAWLLRGEEGRYPDTAPGVRLLTLTGMGGTGKTRLSIEAARRVVDGFPGGVTFVALADLTDSRRLPEAILAAMGRPLHPEQEPLEQLLQTLDPSDTPQRLPLLLILDNLEHLLVEASRLPELPNARAGHAATVGVTPILRALLENIPQLSLLATSRHALGMEGEREYPLDPLPTPSRKGTPERLMEFPSVQLFVDRAQGMRPDFQITPHNADAVGALCEKLEGLPLAVELAAGWARMLTPSQILERMEHRFELLVSRKGDRPSRHRTLQAALEWSYDLLSPALQRFFARLSVFRGGWSLEAAEAVCAEPTALECLRQLSECSLILAEETALGMRYRMLETVRVYAGERAPEAGEAEAAQERHRAYFIALAAKSEPQSKEAQAWLDTLETEHDNLLAAFDAEFAPGRGTEQGLQAARNVATLHRNRGYLREGLRRCDQALAATHLDRTDAYAFMLIWRMGLRILTGDDAGARADGERALAIRRQLGQPELVANALMNLGYTLNQMEEFEQARSYLEEGLSLAYATDQDKMEPLGNQDGMGLLSNLGISLFFLGDVDGAEDVLRRELELERREHKPEWETGTLYCLGRIAQARGDSAAARDLFCQSLRLSRALGYTLGLLEGLLGVAGLAQAEGVGLRAARLYGAHEAFRQQMGYVLEPLHRPEIEADSAAMRAALGEEAFKAAWAEGRSMTLEQAIEDALHDTEAERQTSSTTP
jgi:predicted ATPase/DNA-binding SARP family transcriptional activator